LQPHAKAKLELPSYSAQTNAELSDTLKALANSPAEYKHY
jgi:hypothetical protein